MILNIRGKQVQIDDADFPAVSKESWNIMKSGNTHYCRMTTGESIMMHRWLMGLGKEDREVVDHINGNGLDNRRANLRITNHSGNAHNLFRHSGKVPYIGVYQDGKRFRALLRIGKGKRLSLGTFDTPELAAMAYNIAARRYLGEMATKYNERKLKEHGEINLQSLA